MRQNVSLKVVSWRREARRNVGRDGRVLTERRSGAVAGGSRDADRSRTTSVERGGALRVEGGGQRRTSEKRSRGADQTKTAQQVRIVYFVSGRIRKLGAINKRVLKSFRSAFASGEYLNSGNSDLCVRCQKTAITIFLTRFSGLLSEKVKRSILEIKIIILFMKLYV